MKLDRAIRVESDAMHRIDEAFRAHVTYHETHASLIERMTRIFTELPSGTPRYVREYLRGYWHAKSRENERNLIFGAWITGQFYCHERGNPNSVDARGITYSDFAALLAEHNVDQAHYWRDNPTKPY